MEPRATERPRPTGPTGRRPPAGGPFARALGAWLLALAAIAAAFPLAEATAIDDYPRGSSIDWIAFEPSLFARSRAENRPLFLYFHGQWCTWCRDFQEQSLEHPEIAARIQRDFLPVLIDLDRRRDLFTRYGGRGLPFVVLLDAHGDVQVRFTGHVGPGDLDRILREQRRQVSVTGRETGPSDHPIASAEDLLAMLEQVHDPNARRLSGSALFGTLSKRPQPWTLLFLLHQPEWCARMPALLDQVIDDLADPENGGFFFFHDPDQPDAQRARETSKRLDQNAAFLWLFAEAHAVLGDPRYATVARRTLDYLEEHLWDPEEKRFFSSQYSDPHYYALSRAEHERLPAPPVDRTTLADASGQAIAALIRAAESLQDPSLLDWAGTALSALDEHLRHAQGYYHALPQGGPPELPGYLPAQVWPAIARQLYREATGDPASAPGPWLARVAAYHDPGLDAYRERLGTEIEPWVEPRTQAALAWWWARVDRAELARAGVDPERVRAQLRIRPGDDPDDIALGFLGLRGHPENTGVCAPLHAE
jgi:uncharacterized protein